MDQSSHCEHDSQLAHDEDSVDNLETEHSGLTTWILIDIDDF